MMQHSPLLGHLPVIGKLLANMPPDAHGDYMMLLIQENWQALFPACKQCPPVFYLDLWPFAAPFVISVHPAVSAQFTQEFNLNKAPEQNRFLYPLTRNLDVSSSNGTEWKIRRKCLNLAFSPSAVLGRVSEILDEVDVFVSALRERAGKCGTWGPVFPLEHLATLLALDVMGRFLL